MDATPLTLRDSACRNCGANLTGPYCSDCGQHAHESARSLHTLFHDAWHLVTHLDGRSWATLALLLFKPGRLTREYFADHRARYMPPFRLYFVISIAFFALASVTTTVSSPVTVQKRAELHQELQDGLAQSDVPAALATTVDAVTSRGLTPEVSARLCGQISLGLPRLDQRLQSVCRHQLADQGKSMMHAFSSLIPKTMFLCLPLMAWFMLALYHSPARYYVEHLVFFLHLQSALFLAMILQMLLTAAADAAPLLTWLASLGEFILFCYIVWYIYAAIRNYYQQGRARSLGKFAVVVIAYLVCFILSLNGTLLLSALLT